MKPVRFKGISRGFTLVEILVTVVILGIAGALVVPAMGSTGILRVQGGIRRIVSDLTFVQADAVAFQEQRALVFDVDSNSYRAVEVPGTALAPATNTMYDPSGPDGRYIVDFSDERFGDFTIESVDFDGNDYVIFDSLGGPVTGPGQNTPSAGGSITVTGSGSRFRIDVEAFTGRVTVTRLN